MKSDWKLTLGAVRGINLPQAVVTEEHRLRRALAESCHGPYDAAGTKLGLALYVEGDDRQLDRGGIKIEQFKNNYIGARIYVHKADWNTDLSVYRSFLWQQVEKAVSGCAETLKKKQIELDMSRLRRDLDLAKSEFNGLDTIRATVQPEELDASVDHDKESESEDIVIVVQYRIAGHGSGSDHDKRVRVENLLGDLLEDADLGYCNGGDIGSGTMNVFCFAKPGREAGMKIVETLRKVNLLDGAVVAQTVNGEELVIWPPDFVGEFSVI